MLEMNASNSPVFALIHWSDLYKYVIDMDKIVERRKPINTCINGAAKASKDPYFTSYLNRHDHML
jgi:hypothetical protein